MSRLRQLTLFLLAFLAPLAAGAVNVQQNADGSFFTGVLVNGPSPDKYDIVFIGDGFKESEQALFNAKVDAAVAALQALTPYSIRMCALNIWRVNVISPESGVDHPKDSIFKNTELDVRYGDPADGEAERCIRSDSPQKCFEASALAPDADAVFVLANDTQWGGCAGSLIFSSISSGFSGIITHELGHNIGALADEYTCYVCDGSDDNLTYTGPEPGAVNATIATTLANLKWSDLVTPGTPLPTTVNNPVGVVGLWEGTIYNAKGVFRPQSTCHMRTTGSPFCKVCERQMTEELQSHCAKCEYTPMTCKDLGQYVTCRPPCDRIRWPFPPGCRDCSNSLSHDDVVYELDVLGEGYALQVLDDHGKVIARGERSREGLAVRFTANRSKSYFFELTGPGVSQTLNIQAHLFRNGVAEALPSGGL